MFKLGEFHLQLAFVGACALRKDIQDQAGPVDHATIEFALKVSLLGRTQPVIDKHDLGTGLVKQLPQLFQLAAADQIARINLPERSNQGTGHFGTCRKGERLEFLLFFGGWHRADLDVHENSTFAMTGPVKQDPAPVAQPARIPCCCSKAARALSASHDE